MQQELINLIDELRKTGNQVAQTFTLSLAHNDMDAEMWERLCDGVKEINIKSQEAFLLAATLRGSTTK